MKKLIKIPYYDPSSNKIMNCKPNTRDWFHEEAHRNWYKRGIEQLLNYWMFFFLLVVLTSLSFSQDNWAIRIVGVIPFILFLTSEFHANYVAWKKWFKYNKKKSKK